jgi:NSS family neurotransmitter:Na+ symporter
MSTHTDHNRGSFSNKFAVIASTAGSAVGLGNIWRFPYVTGENGGGAFLLVYLLCVIIMGIPVMTSEFVIGRAAQKNAYGSFKKLQPKKHHWHYVGILGIAAAFMILAFYTTVAGWTLEYFFQSVTGNLFKPDGDYTAVFNDFSTSSARPVIWFLVFMGLTGFVIGSGVENGIEKYSKILMPLLFVLLIVLAIRSVTLDGAREGLRFLFKPDLSKINGGVFLKALGQAFFSLSIGMGTLITYGSYIRKNDNLATSAAWITLTDTLIAIIAGIAIFPAVFALGGSPSSGTGLVFTVLPGIFEKMPLGSVFASLFFILLSIAALTSTISILEVVVAYLVEELKLSRGKATLLAMLSASVLGLFAVLSFGALSGFSIGGQNIFGMLDYVTSNIMLPIGGFCVVIFVGWILKPSVRIRELTNNGKLRSRFYPFYIYIVRFVAPVAIALVFLYSLGFFI